MPSWLISLLEPIALQALSLGAGWLEGKFPGLASLIEQVMTILKGSVTPTSTSKALASHLDAFTEPADIKRE